VKRLLSAAIGAALTATVSYSHSASAHDFSGDLLCRVVDSQGRTTDWSFSENSTNDSGSVKTMVETSVTKTNGQTIANTVGSRPVWIMFTNKLGSVTLEWQQDINWMILLSGNPTKNNGWTTGTAVLMHGPNVIANGACTRHNAEPTAGNVGDIAPE
jgi:hypothetical protein